MASGNDFGPRRDSVIAAWSENAAKATRQNGGGTFVRDTLVPYVSGRGYAVAIVRGTAERVAADWEQGIAHAVRKVRREYPEVPYIGTWLADGYAHVDPIIIVPDRESAVIIGRAFAQTAVWSFADGAEVPC